MANYDFNIGYGIGISKWPRQHHVVERFNLPSFPALPFDDKLRNKSQKSLFWSSHEWCVCPMSTITRNAIDRWFISTVMIRSLHSHPHPQIYPYGSDKICSDLGFIRSYNRLEQGYSLESFHPWLFSDQGLPGRSQPQTSPKPCLIFKLVLAMKQSRFDISLETDGTTASLT